MWFTSCVFPSCGVKGEIREWRRPHSACSPNRVSLLNEGVVHRHLTVIPRFSTKVMTPSNVYGLVRRLELLPKKSHICLETWWIIIVMIVSAFVPVCVAGRQTTSSIQNNNGFLTCACAWAHFLSLEPRSEPAMSFLRLSRREKLCMQTAITLREPPSQLRLACPFSFISLFGSEPLPESLKMPTPSSSSTSSSVLLITITPSLLSANSS